MKKKVLSAEALKALKLSAAEEPNEEPKAEDNLDGEENGTPVEKPEAEAEDQTPEVELTEKLSAAEESVLKLQAEVDTLNETLSAKEAELKDSSESIEQLKGIVCGQVDEMRTALNMAELDLTDLPVDKLLKEYESTSKVFMKSLPVGSVVPPEKKTEAAAEVINDSLDASAYRSLTF